MNQTTLPISPDQWLFQMWNCQSARDGGVVRRKVRDVEVILGRTRFEDAVRRRGFHMVENAGQFVVFCNAEPIRLIV
jgi:hypothetical protein